MRMKYVKLFIGFADYMLQQLKDDGLENVHGEEAKVLQEVEWQKLDRTTVDIVFFAVF